MMSNSEARKREQATTDKHHCEWGCHELIAEARAEALREAADGLYLSRRGQHNEGAKNWLHRRANLIDPRTRDSVCEHGYPWSTDCGYCATSVTSPGVDQ